MLLVDPMSFQYLSGAEIDYKEDLEGSQFVIKNPNATTTCGCGSSFLLNLIKNFSKNRSLITASNIPII